MMGRSPALYAGDLRSLESSVERDQKADLFVCVCVQGGNPEKSMSIAKTGSPNKALISGMSSFRISAASRYWKPLPLSGTATTESG